MNKKGQVYLFAAVIVAVIIFGLTVTYNKLEQKRVSDDFKRISDNYNLESATFLNALIENNAIVETKFLEFSAEFSSYAKAKDPGYELFYAYAEGNTLHLGNFLTKTIIARNPVNNNAIISNLNGCYDELNANIQLGGFNIASNPPYITISSCKADAAVQGISAVDICIQDNGNEFCYEFDITKGKPQVMIFTGETELEQRQVYVGGKGFVKGQKRQTT